MPIVIPDTFTAADFKADRFAQVKAILLANPGITISILDGLSLATPPGTDLRVRVVPQRPIPLMSYEDKTVGSNQPKVCYEVSSVSGSESAHSARVTAPLR